MRFEEDDSLRANFIVPTSPDTIIMEREHE